MLWIGITGPMGSGKSTVARLLREMRFEVLDADRVAHSVLGPGSAGEREVFATFGQAVRDASGHLDRRALGREVFTDPRKLEQLENIIHPRVRDEVARVRVQLAQAGHQVAFYDVPLLFEKEMQTQFDYVVVVSADAALRTERVKARSQLTEEEIEERNAKHIASEIKEAQANAVIRNNGSLAELRAEITNVLTKLNLPRPA